MGDKRERERKKERNCPESGKTKNQKIPSFSAFSSFFFMLFIVVSRHTREHKQQTDQQRKWGKKGPHPPRRLQRRRSSHRVLLLKLLPYRIRQAIPISFLFSLSLFSLLFRRRVALRSLKSLTFRPPKRIIVFRNAVSRILISEDETKALT